jgi:ABC-type transport system involved in multi-copper enzyme maturation permease subunit
VISGNFLLLGVMATWLTPLWLIGLGVAAGLIVLLVAYGLSAALSARLAGFVRMTVREGILYPLLLVSVFLAGLTLLATPLVPYRALLGAVSRIPSVGDHMEEITVPPASKDFPIELPFRVGEVQGFDLASDQPLTVLTFVAKGAGQNGAFTLVPNKAAPWRKSGPTEPVFQAYTDVTGWKATNLGDKPARLQILVHSDIEYPEVRIVPIVAVSLIGLFALYFAIGILFPKTAAIAAVTSKESMAQPLYYVTLGLGVVALLLFVIIPYYTFGEDVKVLKDTGLTSIMLLAIIVAVWSASVSISEEIEGRTALTLLSKPVRRRQFILGKFLGILWPVLLLFILLGLWLLFAVSYKVVYDAREVAKEEPTWQICYWEVVRTIPGLVLAFFEAVILTAISVAISTKLPMLANLIVCTSVYVLGHLVPMLVNSSVGKFEIVRFVGQLLATVLPVLDHLNISAPIAAGTPVPLEYLGWAGAYCVLYTAIAMLVALALFEDRDLA